MVFDRITLVSCISVLLAEVPAPLVEESRVGRSGILADDPEFPVDHCALLHTVIAYYRHREVAHLMIYSRAIACGHHHDVILLA